MLLQQAICLNDEFRRRTLYQVEVERVLLVMKEEIAQLFAQHASSVVRKNKKMKRHSFGQTVMTLTDWLGMLEQVCFVNEHFTRGAARECFSRSKMLAINDMRQLQKVQCLLHVGTVVSRGAARGGGCHVQRRAQI